MQELDEKQKDQLWQWGLHEDGVFNNRLNLFLVFESVLLASVTFAANNLANGTHVMRALSVIGIFISAIWWYVQIKQKMILDQIKAAVSQQNTLYSKFSEERSIGIWKLSVTGLLSYILPGLVLLIWIIILVSAA